MKVNTVKEKLENNELAVGAWMGLGSPHVAELLAKMGFDWVAVDAQHGFFGYDEIIRSFQVISSTETVPMVRVGGNDPYLINRMQDAGALGLIVPMITSAQDARRAVRSARHGGDRARSAGLGRDLEYYYQGDNFYRFMEWSDEEVLVGVMIEQRSALENIESIVKVEGVDLIFIGPLDLALALGTRMGSPAHEEAIQTILEIADKYRKPAGIYCLDMEDVEKRIDQGFKFLSVCSDRGLLKSAGNEILAELEKR